MAPWLRGNPVLPCSAGEHGRSMPLGASGTPDASALGRDRPQLPDPAGHDLGTAWADPVLRRVSKRREVSSIVAIAPDGRLYARHFRTSISSRCVIQALRSVRRKIGTPVLVVWDRLNAHRSRATMDF